MKNFKKIGFWIIAVVTIIIAIPMMPIAFAWQLANKQADDLHTWMNRVSRELGLGKDTSLEDLTKFFNAIENIPGELKDLDEKERVLLLGHLAEIFNGHRSHSSGLGKPGY